MGVGFGGFGFGGFGGLVYHRKIRPTQLWVELSWVVAKTAPKYECISGRKVMHGERKRERRKDKKCVLTMASYTFECHHLWCTLATWTKRDHIMSNCLFVMQL